MTAARGARVTQWAIMKSNCDSMSLAALSAVLLFSLPLVASAQTRINGANPTGIIFTNTK
jgi:hypothetical protein